ncbi:shikimate kinase [Acholeplasma equirhinis]|uniref:shikimate kinase n=1 Tax=Acholeplasma equirhinis TaxID=555393 RepID=UPI00197A942B|nr:shikimate kinase [Acholeplasma equirhinis]MBN3490567.1 shikimate kinase [Acholeplasma equirhinis]
MRIYLIGMPGSGKTTIGKRLSFKLGIPFIDLDQKIEEEKGMFIEDIFENYGEDVFRSVETEVLSAIKTSPAVISTGGGIVTQKRNKVLMDGFKVYIDVPIEILKKRLEKSHQRPLLKTTPLEEIYDKRFLKYQDFADMIVRNHDSIEKCVDDIIEAYKGWAKK